MKYLIILFIISMTSSYASDSQYPVDGIPVALKEGAHAVIRDYSYQHKVISLSEAHTNVKKVVTILDQKGRTAGNLYLGYDKLTKISNVKGAVYDHKGRLLFKIKTSEFKDKSAIPDGLLYSDHRLKEFELKALSIPYTVVYEYETIEKNALFYPRWSPQEAEDISVEKALLEISMPSHMELLYKEVNSAPKVKVSTLGSNTVYSWSFSNTPIIKTEAFGPIFRELRPMVYTAPKEFEVEGYKGDMSTWKNFGLWQYKVISGRDKLSEVTIRKLESLVKDETDERNKVKKVYDYLQSTTRYVYIGLGIGGWQPFEASLVEKNGYGDCKALSNYTMAMLKSIGIKSYYTLISATSNATPILQDFPSSQFNHVILCVPLKQDTVWLECTSQVNPFGYMGDFTSDRHALVITESGGKLVKTPAYTQQQNLQKRMSHVTLQPNGNAIAEVTTAYEGIQYDFINYQINNSPEDQKKWIYHKVKIPSFEVLAYDYQENKSSVPVVIQTLKISIRNCATVSGKRIFLTPNLMEKLDFSPPKTEKRQHEIITRLAYHDIDTVVYFLPEGYYPESYPESSRFLSIFGEYSTTFINEENKITYIRELKMNKGRFPAEAYKEYTDFMHEVSKADKARLVLVNKS